VLATGATGATDTPVATRRGSDAQNARRTRAPSVFAISPLAAACWTITMWTSERRSRLLVWLQWRPKRGPVASPKSPSRKPSEPKLHHDQSGCVNGVDMMKYIIGKGVTENLSRFVHLVRS